MVPSRFVLLAAINQGRFLIMAFLSSEIPKRTIMKNNQSSKVSTAATNDHAITGETSALKTTLFPWSIAASVAPDGTNINIEPNNSIRKLDGREFDVTQSTEWMEFLELKEGRGDDAGGAGAYDTLRCDLILSSCIPSTTSNNQGSTSYWLGQQPRRIWGQEYHLNRLRESYKSLFKAIMNDRNAKVDSDSLAEAMEVSEHLMERMLLEAEKSTAKTINNDAENTTIKKLNEDIMVQLFRVTLLWSPHRETSSNGRDRIIVRGHACSSCKPIKIHATPEPIIVSVAVHTDSDAKDNDAIIDESLPTRYGDPQSKIASWCRERKTMEKPAFKPTGASEVLMVRKRIDVDGTARLEVLEGLSSNFFVIDKHGSLRTATEGVLYGYARYLVLQMASTCGLKFDPRPIYLHEASEWKEAFITSSSRLIYPISKILLPEDHNHDDITANATATASTTFLEYWRDPFFDETNQDNHSEIPKWQQLLDEILKSGGYPSLERNE